MTNTNSGDGPVPPVDALALFDRYRDYIRHEDINIHNRMTWFIQLNAFLIASFAVVTGAEINVFASNAANSDRLPLIGLLASIMQLAFAVLGFTSANAADGAVSAASRSVARLRERGDALLAREIEAGLLPGLTGGGALVNEESGAGLVERTPMIVRSLWCFLGLLVIVALVCGVQQFAPHWHAAMAKWTGVCGAYLRSLF